MRFVVVLGVCLLAAAAVAQGPGPGLRSMAGDLTLRGGLAAARENGCSRSWASSNATVETELRVRAGRAELHVTGTHRSRGGARAELRSPGGIYETGDAIDATYRGTATVAGDVLTIQFVDGDVATSRWSGPGTLPLGASTRQPFVARLACTLEPADVTSSSGAVQHVSLSHCRWEGSSPSGVWLFVGDDFWLGRGAGIDVTQRDTMFDVMPDVTISAR
jgi:hypothetical protein